MVSRALGPLHAQGKRPSGAPCFVVVRETSRELQVTLSDDAAGGAAQVTQFTLSAGTAGAPRKPALSAYVSRVPSDAGEIATIDVDSGDQKMIFSTQGEVPQELTVFEDGRGESCVLDAATLVRDPEQRIGRR